MQNYRLLVKILQSWTDRNPENVKLCVSSRENDPFMDVFSTKQRIRLHLLTADDIRKSATGFLTKHAWFANWPAHGRKDVVESIVTRAN